MGMTALVILVRFFCGRREKREEVAEEKTTKRCGAAGQGSRWRRPEAGDWNEMNHVVGVAKVAGEPDGKGEHVVFCPAHDDRNRPAIREVNGEVEAEDRQKEWHRRQREAFHKDWEMRQVKKKRTSTQARAEKERKQDAERRPAFVQEQAQMFVQRLRAR
jgi:hypothetical protein